MTYAQVPNRPGVTAPWCDALRSLWVPETCCIGNVLQAVKVGAEAIADLCRAIDGWAKQVGKEKRTDLLPTNDELDAQIEVCCASKRIPYLKVKQWVHLLCGS